MSRISVIGSGSWGTAVTVYLSGLGHELTLWSHRPEATEEFKKSHENKKYLPGTQVPEGVRFTSDLSECVPADVIVFAIPSHTVRGVARALAPYLCKGQIVLSISKGFDEENQLRLSEVIKEEIPAATVAAMSGPSHAEEVALGLPTTNVVAASDIEVAKYLQSTFNSQNFRIYTSEDVVGVELGGALKNVIALCAGISDGLGYGDNTKAALMTRGIAEITRLGVAMGAKFETFAGLSGIGDLIVTCTSMHSRNRRAGIRIGQGVSLADVQKEIGMVIEGIKTAKAAHMLAEKYKVEMPIAEEAYKVIFEGLKPGECVANLMKRDMKAEN